MWACKKLFCTVDCTIYKAEFEIGSETGRPLEIAWNAYAFFKTNLS
jgi:hypothetical protein